jgi:hypothetical protein
MLALLGGDLLAGPLRGDGEALFAGPVGGRVHRRGGTSVAARLGGVKVVGGAGH